jgi:hypothetical protein
MPAKPEVPIFLLQSPSWTAEWELFFSGEMGLDFIKHLQISLRREIGLFL